jgi:hypothetical protein
LSTIAEAPEHARATAGSTLADRALSPDYVPVPAESVSATAGLPSIETILFDPAAQAKVLRQLQKKGQARRPSWLRLAAAASGAVVLFAGVYVGWNYYLGLRRENAVATASRPPTTRPVAPVAPDAKPPPQTPAVRSAAVPPANSNVPRPVTTAPVAVVPAPGAAPAPDAGAGRLDLSEEWLRAHEALGLPPPKGVKTVKIIPPKSE